MNSTQISQSLIELIETPENNRLPKAGELLQSLNKDDLIKLVVNLVATGESYASACDEAVWLHLIGEGDYHPDSIHHLNLPSFKGALSGMALLPYAVDDSKLCSTCAYRKGTLGNNSETTIGDVEHVIYHEGVFRCHKEVDKHGSHACTDGKALKACQGWVQHMQALQQEQTIKVSE